MLTTAQIATLKADINANGDALALKQVGNIAGLVALYNALDATYIVWKTNVPITQVGDAFDGAELANLTTANTSRLQAIAAFSTTGVNPAVAGRRQMFDDIFSVGGVTRAALAVLWKRNARRLEKLFATGAGTSASPSTMTVEGLVTADEMFLAVLP